MEVDTSAPPVLLRFGWLPLLLSLAVHALLGLWLCRSLSRQEQTRDHRLTVDACVLAPRVEPKSVPDPRLPAPARPSETRPAERTGEATAAPRVAPTPPARFPSSLPASAVPQPSLPAGYVERTSFSEPPKHSSTAGTALTPEASAGGLGSGPPGLTSFFESGGRGRTVVYVIDRSLSMGISGALEVAKQELLASLRRLPENVRFQVIFYNRSAEVLEVSGRTELLEATAENKQAAAARVANLRAEGGTNHLFAIRRALALEPEVIFFVTDAADLTLEEAQTVTRQNHNRSAIYAIELCTQTRAADDRPLDFLARANRGSYHSVLYRP